MSESLNINSEHSSDPNASLQNTAGVADEGGGSQALPEPQTAMAASADLINPSSMLQRSRKNLRTFVVVAVVVMIVIGGGAYAVYAHFFQRGASSPDAVMESLSQAISEKDFVTLYKMVSPEEIDTITESSEVVKSSGSGEFGQKAKRKPRDLGTLISDEAIGDYLKAVDVTTSTMTYDMDKKSGDLAVAKISSWHLKVSVKQELASNLRDRYQNAKGESLSREENNFFDDLDFSRANYDGDVARSFSESIPLEVVIVRESGRWYVSPLMTVAQWSYQDRAQHQSNVGRPDYSANFNETGGAGSAEAAVEQLTEELLDARRPSDLLKPEVTNLIALPERRLAMVYGPTLIGGDDRFSEPLSKQVDIDWSLESTDIGDGRAVVRPGKSKMVLNPGNDYREVTLSFDGGEVDMTTSADSNNTGSVDFSRELANPERLGVVVENMGGGWRVSTSKTIVNVFNLKPSKGALRDLSDAVSNLGVGENDADDLADALAGSVAIAAPVLVVADVMDQLQGIEWTRVDDYSYDPSGTNFSRCSDGNMEACDSLYYSSQSGTYDEMYGKSCGGRDYAMTSGGQCESTYGRRY